MKLLYACADPGIPLDGDKGASVHVRQTLDALARSGVELLVLAARPGRPGAVAAPVLTASSPERLGVKGGGTIAAEAAAIAAARELAAAAPLAPGDVDLVYERYSLWSLGGAMLAERLAVPLVLEVNAPLVDEQARYRGLALAEVAAGIERDVARRAAAVLCVSSSLRDRIARLRGGDEGVHLFPNAVDTDRFRPHPARGETERGDARPTIVFTGSFKPWHGVQDLLDAFARAFGPVGRARLLLVGDGPERRRLEERALSLGIRPHVEFTGAVSHERIPALLADADIAAAPYPPVSDFYFSPLKVGEYMAAGLPVVASSCGDLDPLLRDGESAVRVPPGDVGSLASALGRLAADPGLRRRLGEAARRIAVEHLSLAGSTDRLLRLLEQVRGARPEKGRAGAP